jgi:hypothetical protein
MQSGRSCNGRLVDDGHLLISVCMGDAISMAISFPGRRLHMRIPQLLDKNTFSMGASAI